MGEVRRAGLVGEELLGEVRSGSLSPLISQLCQSRQGPGDQTTRAQEGASAGTQCPSMCSWREAGRALKIPPVLSKRQWEKEDGGSPVPIIVTITTSSFCNCQNQKERPGSLLSKCPTLHESDAGPL